MEVEVKGGNEEQTELRVSPATSISGSIVKNSKSGISNQQAAGEPFQRIANAIQGLKASLDNMGEFPVPCFPVDLEVLEGFNIVILPSAN